MSNKSIKKNYIFNLIVNLTNLLIPLVTAPYLSRILQVEGVGVKSYTLSIVSNFILFATLGMAEYGQIEIARNRDDKYKYSKKIYELGLLRCISTIIVIVIYIITFSSELINTQYNEIYTILIINILANALDFSWVLRGMEDFKPISIVQIIAKIFMLTATFAFVKTSNDLNIAILINSLNILLNSILILPILKRYCIRVKLKDIRIFSNVRESLVYFIPSIAIQIYTVLDKTMIGVITNSNVENGVYEQADKIMKIVLTVVSTVNTIMSSRIAYLVRAKKGNEIKILIKKSTSLCMLIALPITFGTIVIADYFIPVFFGEGYDKAINVLRILSPLAVIIGLSGVIGSHYYTPFLKKRMSNKYLITGAIINFVMNILLIKNFKSMGAAIATIFAEMVVTSLYIINCDKKIFNMKMCIKNSYKYLIASISMAIIVLFVKNILQINILSVCILGVIGMVSYGLILLILKDEYLYSVLSDLGGKISGKIKSRRRNNM